MYYEYSFVSHPKVHFQGTERKLNEFLWKNPGLVQISGGSGSYVFAIPETAQIIEFQDKSSVNPVRTLTPSLGFIIKRREQKNVPEDKRYSNIREIDLLRLVQDLNKGVIRIEDVY